MRALLTISIISLVFCGCTLDGAKDAAVSIGQPSKVQELIPVNYDYEQLGIHLGDRIDDPESKIEWRWDYMNSDYGGPDTTGVDHYMNLNQEVFSFFGQTTLPSIAITTDQSLITKFSATVIFSLPDHQPARIAAVLDSLWMFDLLQLPEVRSELLKSREFVRRFQGVQERISLVLSEEEYGYDRVRYSIGE